MVLWLEEGKHSLGPVATEAPGRTESVSGSLNPSAMLVGSPRRRRLAVTRKLEGPEVAVAGDARAAQREVAHLERDRGVTRAVAHCVVGSGAGATTEDEESRTYQTPWVARTAAGSEEIGKVSCPLGPLPLLTL